MLESGQRLLSTSGKTAHSPQEVRIKAATIAPATLRHPGSNTGVELIPTHACKRSPKTLTCPAVTVPIQPMRITGLSRLKESLRFGLRVELATIAVVRLRALPKPHPIAPIPGRNELTALDPGAGALGSSFLWHVGHGILAVGHRPSTANHPLVQVRAVLAEGLGRARHVPLVPLAWNR